MGAGSGDTNCLRVGQFDRHSGVERYRFRDPVTTRFALVTNCMYPVSSEAVPSLAITRVALLPTEFHMFRICSLLHQ